jgi:squalene/oxidosqualene cyclase-like protein
MIRRYISDGNQIPTFSENHETSPGSGLDSLSEQCLRRGVHFFSMLQTSDGHWSGDFGGPHFLLPGLIIGWYIMGRPVGFFGTVCTTSGSDDQTLLLMQHYIKVHQQIDGGWGTHVESPSTMFGTTLMYVASRLAGMSIDDPVCIAGRAFIQKQGGAVMTASWAKFYLCLLGVMDWKGHNSVPPELWLLPNWFPFHPGRMWVHPRLVYLAMSYLYGHRVTYQNAENDPLVLSLRKELYCTPYENINWIKTRHLIAPMDKYSPIHPAMRFLQNALARYETWSIFNVVRNFIRPKCLRFCLEYLKAEDIQSNFINAGPVNKVFNMLCMFHATNGDLLHSTMVNHFARVPDYLWLAEDGLKMKSNNGSQCWDTAFAVQAFHEANVFEEFPETTSKVWNFLEHTQILSTEESRGSPAYEFEDPELRARYYRHASEGGVSDHYKNC